jgi:hypothetical protein
MTIFSKLKCSSPIICLGVTLVLCGFIFLYVRQRFSMYDKHILEQSKMLKHLIGNIQSNMTAPVGGGGIGNLASDEALQAARTTYAARIVVSDDESDDDELAEDDETETDTDSETDSDSDDDSSDSDDGIEVDDLHLKCNANECANECVDDIKHINIKDSIDELDLEPDVSSLTNETIVSEIKVEKLNYNDECMEVAADMEIDEDEIKPIMIDAPPANGGNETLDIDTHLLSLNDLKKNQLIELCKARNLSINGNRNELIKRLSE